MLLLMTNRTVHTAVLHLKLAFNTVSLPQIREFMRVHRFYFAAKAALEKALNAPTNKLKILKRPRCSYPPQHINNSELRGEIRWLKQKEAQLTSETDKALSEVAKPRAGKKSYGAWRGPQRAVASEWECGCCMTDVPMDACVQCSEAHIFCGKCLQVKSCCIAFVAVRVRNVHPLLL